MTNRLDAIRKDAGEILQRHLAAGVAIPGGFVGDTPRPVPSAAQLALRWAKRAAQEPDPDRAKLLLDRARDFDRTDALQRLAEAEAKTKAARSKGGKARAALLPDLDKIVCQEALRARERRQTPFASASQLADVIVEQVAEAAGWPVKPRTIRKHVPRQIGQTIIVGSGAN